MTRIDTVDATEQIPVGAEVRLHVMPGGHMLCSVAGVDLHPTPGWLCRRVALQMAKAQLNQTATPVETAGGTCSAPNAAAADEARLEREGLRLLHSQAPLVMDLPYEILYSSETGAS